MFSFDPFQFPIDSQHLSNPSDFHSLSSSAPTSSSEPMTLEMGLPTPKSGTALSENYQNIISERDEFKNLFKTTSARLETTNARLDSAHIQLESAHKTIVAMANQNVMLTNQLSMYKGAGECITSEPNIPQWNR
jgi:hypothetical protein